MDEEAPRVRGSIGLGVISELHIRRMIRVRIRPGTEFDLLGLQAAAIFQIMSDRQPAILGIVVFRNRQVNDQRIAAVRIRQDQIQRRWFPGC